MVYLVGVLALMVGVFFLVGMFAFERVQKLEEDYFQAEMEISRLREMVNDL